MRSNLLIFFLIYAVMGQEASEKSEEKDPILSCITCGLEDIDPEKDEEGSYGDERTKGYKPEKMLKMYNHTCDIADELMVGGKHGDNFIRKCPPGVKSCFWDQAQTLGIVVTNSLPHSFLHILLWYTFYTGRI